MKFIPNEKLYTLDLVFFPFFWTCVALFTISTKYVEPSASFALLPIVVAIIFLLFAYGFITSFSSIIMAVVKKRFDTYSILRLFNCILAFFAAPFTLLGQSSDTNFESNLRSAIALFVFMIVPIAIMITNAIFLKKSKN
ncbi:MAG: hypothetical protein H7196_01140 [candidate division SR1 bacterium]|nr:hypothetical protein [candidate division SR1 bacterium]